jgi:O-antigen/teichoic acid export membrane protein
MAGFQLSRQVTGAAFWSYLGVFADRLITFVLFLVIARLVPHSDFGLVLMSMLVVELLQAILDTGLATALIRQTEVSAGARDSAFTINLGASLVIAAALYVAAPALAALSHDARATPMLRLLAFAPLLAGLGSVHVALLQRGLGFKQLAARRSGASLVASAAAIALALAGAGVWALVVRTLLLAAGGTVAAWIAHPFRPKLRLDWREVREIAPTGLQLWASNVTHQVNARGFDMFAGVILGPAALAALRVAGQLVLLLIDLTAAPLTAVGFSVMSRAKDDPAGRREAFAAFSETSALLLFPAFVGLFVVGDPLLPLMFGARWTMASALLPFMCAIAPPLYIQLCVTAALFAAGRSDKILRWSIIEAVLTLVLGLAFARWGLIGLAVAGTLRLYLMAPLACRWLARDAGLDARLLWTAAAPSAAAAAVMGGLTWVLKLALSQWLEPTQLLIVLIGAGMAAYAAMAPFASPRTWAWVREVVAGQRLRRRRLAQASD